MNCWNNLTIGQTFESSRATFTRQDIVEFAEQFDPQPYHLQQKAGKESIFNGLCASGWHVCAVMMRLIVDSISKQGLHYIGSPAVAELRWRKPVYVNDSVYAVMTLDSKHEAAEQQVGTIEFTVQLKNQQANNLVEMSITVMSNIAPESSRHE